MTRLLAVMTLVVVTTRLDAEERPRAEAGVGVSCRVNGVVAAGAELEAKPLDDRAAKVVVRVLNVAPHGDSRRYDLEFYGLEPGEYDLRTFLRRVDGTGMGDVPPLPVSVRSVLPAGQVLPHELAAEPVRGLGGYRVLMSLAGAAWTLALLAILYFGFVRRSRTGAVTADAPPPTLADRLRPLVEGAAAGTLAPSQLADLERTLLAYWRKRLELGGESPAAAAATLRQHPDAGPLLDRLELWLHRPDGGPPADIEELLWPYRGVRADAIPN